MLSKGINLDYYSRMEELQEKLRRSEEERNMLQRQYDIMVQAKREKQHTSVGVVEARYRRYLDEDKRRRDRNSSLLQALDRINSRTASLAAKTERMRLLRKHYEAFIAHAYPSWPIHLDRSRCPLAALPSSPEVSGYGTETQLCLPEHSDYSETQYRDLPSRVINFRCPLTSPLCNSELSISARRDYSPLRRPTSRSGSAAFRSASLSPSRVRNISPRYDVDKIRSPREYESIISPKPYDFIQYPNVYDPVVRAEAYDPILAGSSVHHYSADSISPVRYNDKYSQKPVSSTKHYFLDGDHGYSDVEGDQNTSGDILNLSLSDDGILNDSETPYTPPPSQRIHRSNTLPRESNAGKKSSFLHLPDPIQRSQFSPRESFLDGRKNTVVSPLPMSETISRSTLSPRDAYLDPRRAEFPSSLPISDSVQRILLSPQDTYLDSRRSDIPLSPRRQKHSWQTVNHSFLHQPRTPVRRTVTFNEPELGQGDYPKTETKYYARDDSSPLYNSSYSSLRRYSPSIPSLELTDHERYLRDKQGREKDAFQEKIQRLKELIQENKEQEIDLSSPYLDNRSRTLPNLSKSGSKSKQPSRSGNQLEKLDTERNYFTKYNGVDKIDDREDIDDTDLSRSGDLKEQTSLSRRPSTADEQSPQATQKQTSVQGAPSRKSSLVGDTSVILSEKSSFDKNYDGGVECVSDKEQLSGQFNEKDEDVKQGPMEEENKLEEEQHKEQDVSEQQIKEEEPPAEQKQYSTEQDQQLQPENKIEHTYDQDHETGNVNYSLNPDQSLQEQSVNYYQQETSNDQEENMDHHQDDQQLQQEQNVNQGYQQPQHEENIDYSYVQDQQPPQEQNVEFGYQQEPNANYGYPQDQQPQQEQNINYGYEQSEQPQQGADYSYQHEQEQPVEQQEQKLEHQISENYGEGNAQQPDYTVQEDYNNYAQNSQDQQQKPEEYPQQGTYESYPQDSQQAVQQPAEYSQQQSYPEGEYQQNQGDGQYPQEYQEYQQDNQYAQPQAEYQQDPNASGYTYDGQGGEYNYQEQTGYAYPENPSQQYPQDQQYQQDQSYDQSEAYQPEAYQGAGYDYSQSQQDLAPAPEDQSESSDSRYQPSDQQSYDQYQNLVAAPGTEPSYSESDEIENQMAAVVGQAGSTATRIAEQSPQEYSQPAEAATPAKGKVTTKKRPLLTRKQSTVSSENADGKQPPAAPALAKMLESDSESAPAGQPATHDDSSDFDMSSAQ